jgi:WhiB family redox-sensing transcriptional regulator
MNPDIFYGVDEAPMTSVQIKDARKVCIQCDVRRDCLISALMTNEPYGVWGGFTSFERKAAIVRHKGDIKAMITDFEQNRFIKPRKRKK